MTDSILKVENLSKTFVSGTKQLTVLKNISFTVESGDTLSIVGPSGSGKTTLLGLCAGLDDATEGSVYLNGVLLNNLTQDERSQLRSRFVGFVFQNFQLIPTLTALENVMIPAELNGSANAQQLARDWLQKVGLGDRVEHYPVQLSGGEQQRVALARAFVNQPKILFADEPTGNLDDETGSTITDLLFELNHSAGTTLILVTHNMELAKRTRRMIRLKSGVLQPVTDNAQPLVGR
jgi:putative ABC transport system ATP-binding protein